jgi:phosphohistidine phosphatase
MRRLLLFRHSKAERLQAGGSDRARVLAERGRADAARMGIYLSRHNLVPDRALVSPAARTAETWALAAVALRPAPMAQPDERLYDASVETLFNVIRETPTASKSLIVVGHNPGLHELAVMLIASGDVETRERLREELPTSGLAVIDFAFEDWSRLHARSGRLERFVSPRALEAAAN